MLEPRLLLSTIQLVSVASDGTPGNNDSWAASISGDGRYVAFDSYASNFVPGDTFGGMDVFVYDRQAGTTQCVSVTSDGTLGDSESSSPSISADGRYVAFESFASNLVPDDTITTCDVYVYDRQTGAPQCVSVASGGTRGNDASGMPSISSDGRYVAFASGATNLVPGDVNGQEDIFVHDRQTGATQLVSVASDGTQSNDSSCYPSISADGRYVSFESLASNLVPGDTNSAKDIFVYDRQTSTTQRVSVASGGAQANGTSLYPQQISADGRYVAFLSQASNLVPGDTNDTQDAFVYDRQTGTTQRVSVASDGTQGDDAATGVSISAGGRYVAFDSYASNLVPGDVNTRDDVFVRDRQAGTTQRVSVASDGTQGNKDSGSPSISADGRYVAFDSAASTLVPGDTDHLDDVFAVDVLGSGAIPVLLGQPFSLDIGLTGEGQGPTYSLTAGPAWMSIDPVTGLITGTPTAISDVATTAVSAQLGTGVDAQIYDFSVQVQAQVITLTPAAKKNKAVFRDADGDWVTLTMAGKAGSIAIARGLAPDGAGAYSNATPGDLCTLELDGTTAKDGLTFSVKPDKKAKAGSGRTTFSYLLGGGSLGKLSGKAVDVVGGGIALSGTGTVASVQLGNVHDGAAITLPGPAPKGLTIKLGRVGDCDMTAGAMLKSLSALLWAGGAITAPTIGSLTVTGDKKAGLSGDFGPDVTVTGQGTPLGKPALNAAKIAGQVTTGQWTVTGGVGTLSAAAWQGGITADWIGTLSLAGNAKAHVEGDFTGTMNLAGATLPTDHLALTSAKVAGGLISSDWRFQAGDVGAIVIGRAAESSTIRSAGDIAALTLGACFGSDFLAGIRMPAAGETLRYADATSAPFLTEATIQSFQITGWKGMADPSARLFGDSNVSAAAVTTISLRNLDTSAAAGAIYVSGAERQAPWPPVKSASYSDSDPTKDWTWAWGSENIPHLLHIL